MTFALYPARPNPARSRVEIRYGLPRAAHVRLTIFDVTGCRVRTLRDTREDGGSRSVVWDRQDAAGRRMPSGLYIYSLDVGAEVLRQKVLVVDRKLGLRRPALRA